MFPAYHRDCGYNAAGELVALRIGEWRGKARDVMAPNQDVIFACGVEVEGLEQLARSLFPEIHEKSFLLPHAVKDAVLLSAEERYGELVRRVRAQHGKLNAQSAIHLMD